jgi:hypothetical protein
VSTLAAAASCTVVIAYSPTQSGASSETLTLSYNDATGSHEATLALSGTATPAPCDTVPSSSADYTLVGAGTPASPYLICNPNQLAYLSSISTDWGSSFALGADLDMSAFGPSDVVPFTSIGTATTPFSGTFDGQGHTIANVTIDLPSQDNVGFFGMVSGSTALIERLTLSQLNITGQDNTGGLAGQVSAATILACSTSGVVNGDAAVGGLVGNINEATIVSSSASSAAVSGAKLSSNPSDGIGGLIGDIDYNGGGEIFASYATGTVLSSGVAGGLVGGIGNAAEIWDCYATGDVTAGAGAGGGLIGDFITGGALIGNSFCTGNVSGNTGSGAFSAAAYAQTLVNDSYYIYSTCTIGGDACPAPADGEIGRPTLAYFQTASNAPLSSWDFERTWAAPQGAPPKLSPQFFDGTGWDCSSHQSDFPFAGGYGTPEAPFLICTPMQLTTLQGSTLWQGNAVRLMADIDMTGTTGWSPIGNDTNPAWLVFDGNGKAISNFAPTDNTGLTYFGLFGNLVGGIKRLAVTDANINTDAAKTGIIAGNVNGTVIDSYTTGSISGSGIVSGLVAGLPYAFSFIVNSYSTAAVTSTASTASGLAWSVGAGVIYSFSAATVSGVSNSGQLIGYDIFGGAGNSCTQDQDLNAGNYYDQLSVCIHCCTPSYGISKASNWFYTASNPPMNVWDFVHVWQANANAYPTLR